MIFRRPIGPRPPNIIARAWTAMIAAAPLKEWTRLGAGIALTLFNFAILAAVRFGWSESQEPAQLKALFWMGVGANLLLLVAIVSTFDVNLKIDASKAGFKGDFTHDDDATTAHVEGVVTVTPEAKQ